MKKLLAILALAFAALPAFAQYCTSADCYTYTLGSGNGTSWTTMNGGPTDLQVVFGVEWPMGRTMLPSALGVSGQWNVSGRYVLSINHTTIPDAPTLYVGQYAYVLQTGVDANGNCIYLDGVPCQYSTDGYGNILLENTQTSVVFDGYSGYTGAIVNFCLQQFGVNTGQNQGVNYVGCTHEAHFGGDSPLVTEVSVANDANGLPISFVQTHAAPYSWAAGVTNPDGTFTVGVSLPPGLYVIDTPGITSCTGRNCSIPGGTNFNTSWKPTFTAPPPPPPCTEDCGDSRVKRD